MQINLLGWSVRGMRCPDVNIDLKGNDGSPAPVALIQMPNGTGKTTMLELLRAALSGEGQKWAPDKVRDFRRPGSDNASGNFSVTLSLDGKPLTFEMILGFDEATVTYRSTWPGEGGVKEGWQPPPSVRQFLTEEFLGLFIFDGEFADDLLSQGVGRADEAIGALCQLDLLSGVSNMAKLQWDKATSQGGPKSPAALDKLNQERDALEKRQTKLEKARAAAVKKLASGETREKDLEKKIADRVGSIETTKLEHSEAKTAWEKADRSVGGASGAVMRLMRMPFAVHQEFADQLSLLKENLDSLRLPETSSAQFFSDLVNDPECICGREMTAAAAAEITKRAKGYLDYEESGVINALKSDIGKYLSSVDEGNRNEEFYKSLSELSKAVRERKAAEQSLEYLTKKLIDAGDNELKSWQDELDELTQELKTIRRALSDIDDPNEGEPGVGEIHSLKRVRAELVETEAKIAKLTETVELKAKTDILQAVVAEAEAIARDKIRSELLDATNERLQTVLSNDPLQIERIDRSLHLVNQRGASAGQKLSVGYTFLMSALKRGNNDFPLIVDSPAGPIDEGVRRNIGELIPELCTQFVAFTINTERPGFVPALERKSKECLFLTVFRRTEGTKRLEANLPAQGVTRTETATMVRDRDYFMQFDVSETEVG